MEDIPDSQIRSLTHENGEDAVLPDGRKERLEEEFYGQVWNRDTQVTSNATSENGRAENISAEASNEYPTMQTANKDSKGWKVHFASHEFGWRYWALNNEMKVKSDGKYEIMRQAITVHEIVLTF